MIASETLVDGTACIVDTTAATEVAAVGVWYARGSRDEREGEKGAMHFIEHMLFKGTAKRDAFQIAREVDRLGGAINAFTERESVAFFAIVPEDGFEKAAEILCDITADAQFDAAEFERERSVIENELSAAEDDPEEVASDSFAETLWQGHPLGAKIGGTIAELASLKRDSVYELYKNEYAGKPDLITVAGGIDTQRALGAFSSRFQAPCPKPLRSPPTWPAPAGAFYKSAPFQHVQVFLSFQLPGTLPLDEYYALQIANTATGDSMSSRLFQSLRERRGLCYSVYSAPTLFSDAALWTIFASSTVDTIPALVEGMGDEILKLLDGQGLDAEEISDAKAQLRGGMKLESMDIEHLMRRLARQSMYGSEPHTVAEASAIVSAIDPPKANASLLRFMSESKPLLFAIGPARAQKRFMNAAEAMLKKLGA